VHADQVLGRQVEVVFSDLDLRPLQFGRKEDDEGVAGVLLDLRPLVLVADVLEGQLVKLEGMLEQGKVGVIGVLDVEPESLFALTQAFGQLIGGRLGQRTLGRNQVPGDGYPST
jgi:hypothetical protein